MHLTDLPEEIIIIIIRELDLQALECVYNTSQTLRAIVCMHGVIRQWNMSLNTMATARTLKLNLLKDIAGHLQELNLCGVPDLCKTALLPVAKTLKSLKKLDVSYTNITIIELLDVLELCPTVCDITVNYIFVKPCAVKVPKSILILCQAVFECMKNVHFIGTLNKLLHSQEALFVLQKAKLSSVKYTIAESDYVYINQNILGNVPLPVFDTFSIFLLNWKDTNVYYGYPSKLPILSKLELAKCEFIVIVMPNLNSYTVYVSPMFINFFSEHFHIDVECTTQLKSALLIGNVGIWFWNKETTKFDVNFFHRLKKQMKNYFPRIFDLSSQILAPKNVDWFYTVPQAPETTEIKEPYKYEPEIRKRRIGAPNLVLNYDTVFIERQNVKLSLIFKTHIPNAITLTSNCNFLKKLTFLSLTGSVRYSSEFFNILFRCCETLKTLNIHSPSISPCASSISRSIPLSRSLKNIRLVDKRIDFKTLFSSLSQCPTLENIHVLDNGKSEPIDIGDPSIILEKCHKLYILHIEAPMSETSHTKKTQLINKAKARCNKYGVHFVLCATFVSDCYKYNYDPYMDVFNLNPMKPI